MISHLEREVTFRFLRTRKNDGFLNIISIFSFIGISLGVAVLIIVMSVMNGFRTELISKIVGFNAHAVVQQENKPLKNIQELDLAKNIVSSDGEAVIMNKNITKGVFLKGYFENDFRKLQIVNNKEFFGTRNLPDNTISIGKEMSFIANWSYPTEVRFGESRIFEIREACNSIGINRPLIVTDRNLVKLKFVIHIWKMSLEESNLHFGLTTQRR